MVLMRNKKLLPLTWSSVLENKSSDIHVTVTVCIVNAHVCTFNVSHLKYIHG